MNVQEQKEFEEFQEYKRKKALKQKKEDDRATYDSLVEETIDIAIPILQDISKDLENVKKTVLSMFKNAIDMKKDIGARGKTKEEIANQYTHDFTNKSMTKRIRVGYNTIDAYSDMANEGILIVKEYIENLVYDEKSKILVSTILSLLSKDDKGNLKASKIVQLRKIAEKHDSERLMEGVKIIEESYRPTKSKQFIRAEIKGENNEWISIPLGVSQA